MSELTRRGFLRATAAVGGTTAGLTVGGLTAPPAGAEPSSAGCAPRIGPVTVGTRDPRYLELTTKAYNGRFTGRPESVRVLGSPEQVPRFLEEAVRSGKRFAVRGGGHCFENFVDDPAVRLVADISEMRSVYFDPGRQAFAVEAGATLGEIYRRLYLGWGVTIPGGTCPSVGAGGHVVGGGYGLLSQQHGMVIDHLEAVEVAVVGRSGRAELVVGSRSPQDPNHDLWWAHTGGGGGNFGIATRYWFRSPNAVGTDPGALLPKPPSSVTKRIVTWNWADLTEQSLTTLVRNYGRLHAGGGAAPDPRLHSSLGVYHQLAGIVILDIQLVADAPDGTRLIDDYIAAVARGVDAPPSVQEHSLSWLKATPPLQSSAGRYRFKTKSGLLRKPWSDEQIATVYRYLTDGGPERSGAAAYLGSFGGAVNSVPATATAMTHRDSALVAFYETGWQTEAEDAANLAWLREFYRDVYATTGGVPVPNAENDGTFINYADADLADPAWNTSGVPWHAMYYRDNYPRLQQIKARWDPRNVFRHALSIQPSS